MPNQPSLVYVSRLNHHFSFSPNKSNFSDIPGLGSSSPSQMMLAAGHRLAISISVTKDHIGQHRNPLLVQIKPHEGGGKMEHIVLEVVAKVRMGHYSVRWVPKSG